MLTGAMSGMGSSERGEPARKRGRTETRRPSATVSGDILTAGRDTARSLLLELGLTWNIFPGMAKPKWEKVAGIRDPAWEEKLRQYNELSNEDRVQACYVVYLR